MVLKLKVLFSDFSALKNQIESLEQTSSSGDTYLSFLKDKFEVYNELVAYILNVRWLSREKAKTNMVAYLNAGLSTAEAFKSLGGGTSSDLNRFRSSISTSLKALDQKFGEGFLKSLRDANDLTTLSDVSLVFSLSTGNFHLNSLFLSEVSSVLPEPRDSDVPLASAELELRTLRQFTKWFMRSRVSERLNEDLVAKILFILSSNSPAYSVARVAIYGYLTGKTDNLTGVVDLLSSLEI